MLRAWLALGSKCIWHLPSRSTVVLAPPVELPQHRLTQLRPQANGKSQLGFSACQYQSEIISSSVATCERTPTLTRKDQFHSAAQMSALLTDVAPDDDHGRGLQPSDPLALYRGRHRCRCGRVHIRSAAANTWVRNIDVDEPSHGVRGRLARRAAGKALYAALEASDAALAFPSCGLFDLRLRAGGLAPTGR